MTKLKELQNNFTTPEQSKRLLDIGVPADSADCYWRKDKHGNLGYVSIIPSGGKLDEMDVPCWSVGRLIEIITICREEVYTRLLFSRVDDHTNIENLIHYISTEIENGHIDFSKLEE